MAVVVEPMAAPRRLGHHIVAPPDAARVGAADDGQQQRRLIARNAESPAEPDRHRNRVIGLEDDLMLGAIMILPIDRPFAGQCKKTSLVA